MTVSYGIGKTQFSSTFWKTDPQYVQNLSLWRQYPGIPEVGDVTKFGAILPIVATQSESAKSVNVSFSIFDLPSTNSISLKSQAFNLLTEPGLPGMAPQGMTVNTIAPVQAVRSTAAVALYFDIASVPRAEIGTEGNMYSSYGSLNPRKTRISAKAYNVSNGVNIISEPPMVDEVVGTTATFSFDITELPRI